MAGPFTRLTTSPVTGTSFNHSSGSASTVYMVRAVKLESSGSGTYFNASQGVFASVSGGTTINDRQPRSLHQSDHRSPALLLSRTRTPPRLRGWFGWMTPPDRRHLWQRRRRHLELGQQQPAPFSGQGLLTSHLSPTGMHQHYFDWAGSHPRRSTPAKASIPTFIWIRPILPSEVMLEWNNGTWEHRAYWGANNINNGVNGTASRRYMGACPPPASGCRLMVPPARSAWRAARIRAMTFTLYGGRATWIWPAPRPRDRQRASPGRHTNTLLHHSDQHPATGSDQSAAGRDHNNSFANQHYRQHGQFGWMKATPPVAVLGSDGGDSWNWISSNPAPFSGQKRPPVQHRLRHASALF